MGILETNMLILQVTGFWIDRSQPKDIFFYIKQVFVHNIGVFAVYGFFYGLPMYMYKHSDNFSEVSECMGNAVGSAVPAVIYLTFVLKNEELATLVQLLRNVDEAYPPNDAFTRAIDKHTKKLCQFWSVSFTRAGIAVFGFLSVVAAIDVIKERDIEKRLKTVYPIDVHKPGNFEFVVFVFACNFFYGTFMIIGCNLMVMCMFFNVVGQLRMLNYKFGSLRSAAEAIVREKSRAGAGDELPVEEEQELGEECTLDMGVKDDLEGLEHSESRQNLDHALAEASAGPEDLEESSIRLKMQDLFKQCIAHHCDLLKFIRAFEDYWNAFFSVNVTICLAQSVLYLTSAAMKSGNSNLLVHFGIIATFYSMLGIFCYLSQQVTVETELLKESIYGCEWTDASASFKRSVGIMVSVANRPIVIKAGGFIPLSMVTFKKVINSAYSYYMVLRSF